MVVNKIAICSLIIKCFINQGEAYADEEINQDWMYISNDKFSKASTKNETGSEFGIICADKCFYYISSGIQCISNKKYLVMMSTEQNAKTIEMTCVKRGEIYFQILDKANEVKKAVDKSENISFITSLDKGAISASFFGLKGAKKTINEALNAATKNNYPKPELK